MKPRIFSVLSTFQIRLFTFFRANKVGTDADGNQYYTRPARKGLPRDRRWVIYKHDVEATRVPPEWHGWLHHQTDRIPDAENVKHYQKKWQKEHRPNLTGTTLAYRPPGHVLEGGKRDKASGDYEAWTP